MDENKKHKKIIIMILLVTIFIMFIAGITYAFFTAVVADGDRGSSITINTATLGLRYSEDPITCLSEGAMPGETCTHNFFVENIGDATVDNYYVYLWDIINTFETTSDLVYEITCKSINSITKDVQGTCIGKSETEVPTEDSLILSSSSIEVGVTHEYQIKLTFKETDVNQNENQGKTFTGKILVVTENNAVGKLLSPALFTPNGNISPIESQSIAVIVKNATVLKYVWSEEIITDASLGEPFENGETITKSGTSGEFYLCIYAEDELGNAKTDCSGAFLFLKSEFAYTGTYEELTVPKDGYYQIELWGAQGGKHSTLANFGANGGYISGTILLNKGEKLYVYVGENSVIGNSTSFNGGTTSSTPPPGGGATDIRYFGSGYTPTLTELAWNNVIGLRSRIIAAGGGGSCQVAGMGGGLIGLSGLEGGGGGTQVEGGTGNGGYTAGSFGIGANGCGGGGGYYGGGGGSSSGGGGGGSSFISGYAGVNAITSASSTTATNNTIHYSGKYFINTSMIAGDSVMPSPSGGTMTGNTGHGYAKVTYVGESSPAKTNTKLNNVRYIKACVNGNSVSISGIWTEIQTIKNGVNIAKGKTVTGTVAETAGYPYTRITDGIIDTATYAATNVAGLQCVTVDLGDIYDLDEVALWLHYRDGRKFYDNTLSVGPTNPGNTTTTSLSTILHNYPGTTGYNGTSQGKRYTAWD